MYQGVYVCMYMYVITNVHVLVVVCIVCTCTCIPVYHIAGQPVWSAGHLQEAGGSGRRLLCHSLQGQHTTALSAMTVAI